MIVKLVVYFKYILVVVILVEVLIKRFNIQSLINNETRDDSGH